MGEVIAWPKRLDTEVTCDMEACNAVATVKVAKLGGGGQICPACAGRLLDDWSE